MYIPLPKARFVKNFDPPRGNSVPDRVQAHRNRRWNRLPHAGFSRGELLAVLFIAAIAASLLLPYLLHSQAATRRIRCEKRLIALGQALQRFESETGLFPGYCVEQARDAAEERFSIGWAYAILPMLEDSQLELQTRGSRPQAAGPPTYRDLAAEYSSSGAAGQRGEKPVQYLPELVCPAGNSNGGSNGGSNGASVRQPITSFVANCGQPDSDRTPYDWAENGLFLNRFLEPELGISRDRLQSWDGDEFTLMLSENLDAGLWTDAKETQIGFLWKPQVDDDKPMEGDFPLPINKWPDGRTDRHATHNAGIPWARPSSHHPRGVNCLFASGRTMFVEENIDHLVWVQMMTPHGAESRLAGSNDYVPDRYRNDVANGSGRRPTDSK